MKKMKKTEKTLLFLLAAVLLLTAPGVGTLPAAAETEPYDAFTAQVTLLGMEEGSYGQWTFRVALPDSEMSVETDRGFKFMNARNNLVPPEQFFAANENKPITIDFIEIGSGYYLITECMGENGYRGTSSVGASE